MKGESDVDFLLICLYRISISGARSAVLNLLVVNVVILMIFIGMHFIVLCMDIEISFSLIKIN